MLPVVGQPMIGRVMACLAGEGADRFVLVVHPDDDALIYYLKRSVWRDAIQLAYQAQQLGMAHALSCATTAVKTTGARAFLLASCDNLYPEGHAAALAALQQRDDLDAALTLMSVRPEQIPTLAVVALTDGLVTHIVEKPTPEEAPSNLGVPALYALSTAVFDCLSRTPVSSRGEREFPDALRLWIEDGARVGGLTTPWRMTMTHPSDLLALNRYFLHRQADDYPGRISSGGIEADVLIEVEIEIEIEPPVHIEAGARLETGCRIGPEVYVETGAHIGAGALVRRAVILRGSKVAAGGVIEDRVLCARQET